MKKATLKIFIVKTILLFSLTTFGQEVIFTTRNTNDEDIFYRVNVNTPFVYENVSDLINSHALYTGKNKGPISVSHNGEYYVFKSERFEDPSNMDGYEAITICKTDFTYFEVPKDQAGHVFHSDGIMQISNDGNTIYFVKGGMTHSMDIFKITRLGSIWEEMQLTGSSNYDYNIAPYLSYEEDRLLYESSNDVTMSTAISQITVNALNNSVYVSIADINGATQMKSPAYDVSNNVYFEAETDAERIWKINVGGSPEIINTSYTNDNSPVTLPDGKVISVFIGASTHQIKVMDNSGVNLVMLTESNSEFEEVFDIGISAGNNSLANNMELELTDFSIFPNPCSSHLFIHNLKFETNYTITDLSGKIVQIGTTKGEIVTSKIQTGFYFLKLNENSMKIKIE
jgi:hypothetical protein